MKDEKQYNIGFDFPEPIQNDRNFTAFKRQILRDGYLIIKHPEGEVNVYTPELAFILLAEKLRVTEFLKSTQIDINAKNKYLQVYIEGYKNGQDYFDKEFAIPTSDIYGKNGEYYIRDIHQNYFHIKHGTFNEGWVYVKRRFPITLSCKEIRDLGYYSGIVSKVDAMKKKYPQLFATFDNCEQNLPDQQTETKTKQLTPTFVNNFDNISPTEICKHFKAGLVEKGYLTELELNEFLKAAFELKIIPKTLFKIKNAPTKQKVNKVFYEYYKNIAGKPHGKQNQYAALLGKYFEGYNTENVSSNFNK